MNRKAPIFFLFSIFLLDLFVLSSIFFHYILATSDSFLLFTSQFEEIPNGILSMNYKFF